MNQRTGSMMLHARVLAVLFATAVGATAGAQNVMFLDRSPITYLTEADKQILGQSLERALQDAEDGDVVEWHNPDTGHHGSFRILDTHEDFDTTCRNVLIRTYAGGLDGGGRYRLCDAGDNDWRFAAPGRPATHPPSEDQKDSNGQ